MQSIYHFPFSRTPLHYAAANCNYQCLFALVGSGASVNDLDEKGCTPLHYAAASDTDGKSVKPVEFKLASNVVAVVVLSELKSTCRLPSTLYNATVALTLRFLSLWLE